jgi:hypothetical protein
MNNLTPQELEDKIKQVQKDIQELHNQAVAGRKLEVLNEYQQYLEDELKMLRNQSSKKR